MLPGECQLRQGAGATASGYQHLSCPNDQGIAHHPHAGGQRHINKSIGLFRCVARQKANCLTEIAARIGLGTPAYRFHKSAFATTYNQVPCSCQRPTQVNAEPVQCIIAQLAVRANNANTIPGAHAANKMGT